MVSGRTLSLLAIAGFIISMIVWGMSEQRNTKMRGELLDKVSAEAASNIQFLQTGRHNAAAKDEADDAMQEITTGGRQQLDARWLTAISMPGIVKTKDARLVEIRKLMTMIATYNAELGYSAEEEAGEDNRYPGIPHPAAPAKQQMIDEFNRLISVLKEAKEHKNNLNF